MATNTQNAAYILARHYNFLPKFQNAGNRARLTDDGKYEPDENPGGSSRTMILAAYTGKSNLLVKYKPDELTLEN